MITTWLKGAGTYLLGTLIALVGVLGIALKWSLSSRKRLKDANKRLKANRQRAREVAERDNELEAQTRSRRATIAKELEESGISRELEKPNDWD